MKSFSFAWLLVALLPSCLLVQPLDEAKPSDDGSGGTSSSAGSNNAGRNSGGGGKGGGAPNAGGAHSGGAPNGADFSLFTGSWTVKSGSIVTDCGTGPMTTMPTTGTIDTVDLGTTSDLILDEGTQCPVSADVTDRTATGQPGQTCDFTDEGSVYHLDIQYFDFIVGSTGRTASSTLTSVVSLTTNGVTATCDSNQTLSYAR